MFLLTPIKSTFEKSGDFKDAVLNYIENLSKETPREQTHYERIRYLFYTLYLLSLRVNEVATAMMRYIKRNARHKSVETTMLYQHAEEEKWHDAMSLHQVN